jgi:Holliday junction resolvase
MENQSRGIIVGGHDGSFLVIDRVDMVDYVFGVRSHTGEVSSIYLRRDDIEKLVEFLSRKRD